jgi:hypothetical protein
MISISGELNGPDDHGPKPLTSENTVSEGELNRWPMSWLRARIPG